MKKLAARLFLLALLLAGLIPAQTRDLQSRRLASVTFANLGTPADGTIVYCSDCTQANPVASGGTGAVARRENGAWNGGGGAGGSGITQITGDATAGPGSGSQALTLATVNSNTGACGDSTHVCQVTLDGKGRATAASAVAITGSGISSFFQLSDFGMVKTSGTVETIGTGCSSSAPCQIRQGSIIYTLTSAPTATISGSTASETVYWYLSSSLVLTVGHNGADTLTCSAGCTVATGITGFPADSTPLWATTMTSNVWDAIAESMDKRAFNSRTVIAPGSGVSSSSDPSTGIQTLSTDATIVPRYFTGSGAPGINCTTGRDFYTDTSGLDVYFCDATNTWKKANGSGGAAPYTDYEKQTTGITMTGSNVDIYSVASVSALAAGKCYHIQFGIQSPTVATNFFLFVDATQIDTVWPSASSAYIDVDMLYCNDPGSQTVQALHYLRMFYIGGTALPTASSATQNYTSVMNATPVTPTGVTWSSTHTISIKANAASGTATGAFFHITQE